jgi:L-seryl-tRNA(Ser) seleniumtransferase
MGSGVVGGGTFPGVELPSWTVRIRAGNPGDLARRLRAHDPPVVTRVEGEEVVLDPRTVDPDDDGTVLSAILSATAAGD